MCFVTKKRCYLHYQFSATIQNIGNPRPCLHLRLYKPSIKTDFVKPIYYRSGNTLR